MQRFRDSYARKRTAQPGEMLIVDNQLAAHARTGFKPLYDGFDRWLQRISAIRDTHNCRSSLLANTNIFRPVNEEASWNKQFKKSKKSAHE